MMRSDGHTEAEILATSEAYKCDVFVLREQYTNIGCKNFLPIRNVTTTKSRSRY